MSPPPWTLFWPRSGLTPLPYRPTWPVSRMSEMSDRTLSTALWCSVMPSVQQIIARGDVAADVEPEPQVRPLRARCPSRVDRDQAGAVADAAQHVMEEDRMRLSGV